MYMSKYFKFLSLSGVFNFKKKKFKFISFIDIDIL